ncbi:MAG TPA: DUF1549 and DUF1553 domain-containing protein [Tepidisphaeraceae bacterium]|jgi:hypothetical protein|nr:DUF1549 and DUF1553 domain-containing protein [Tepidisphaeraceae bacterium]
MRKAFSNIVALGALSAIALFAPISRADDKPAPPPFHVFPADINLESATDTQSVVVQTTRPDGITQDITSEVKFELADPKLAGIDGNVFKPLADGQTQVKVTWHDQSVTVPVVVKDATVTRPISFRLDVMPIFLRSGCNVGGCHGAARGRDGFRLSLFGFEPAADYNSLTRQITSRRIDLALPEESLVLTKATGKVPHTGGERFKPGTPRYNTLLAWLKAGAPDDDVAKVAKPVSAEILPPQMVLEEGMTQQMTVRAHYSDGTDRDVTSLALFLSNNDNSAKPSEEGKVTAGNRGEAFVMARFATFTIGSQVIVVPKGQQYKFPDVPENNYIDTLVDAKLKKLRILPSELCSDEVFLRRAHIDICGNLPTVEEHDRFLADKDSAKREKLVDELLSRKEFVDIWVMKWAELLQIRSDGQQVSYKNALLYYNWLEDKIAHNVPFDQIVQELLGANGGTFKNPATNYYQITTDTLKVSENTAQVFMGMRIQCAQCHNHPFDRWTQDDYYGFAAFFSQIGRKQAEDPRETIVFNRGNGEVNHPVGGRVMQPKFLGGEIPDVKGKDRRVVLAKWLASSDNPYFAKNLSNIVWAHFFGKGIIDPVDDVRVSNPAVNPELLDTLAQKFTEYHYDFKRLVRDICTSRTYQLASETNESNEADEHNFSHSLIRRMRAEVVMDCMSEATGTKDKFRGLPLGSRAVQIADGATTDYFLTTFGRATRETVCSCEVKMDPNLSQALAMINGNTVSAKVGNSPVINEMFQEKKTPEQMVVDLYVRTLGRNPTNAEMASLSAQIAQAGPANRPKVMVDIFWALLNSQEFMFNH